MTLARPVAPFTTTPTVYPITFCFCRYDPDRSFSWMNCLTNAYTGRYIHCETYDGTEKRGAFITRDITPFTIRIRYYEETGYDFITVLLDNEQHERYISFVYSKKDRVEWSDAGINCFFANCCGKCAPDVSGTCSEIMAGLICYVWGIELERPHYKYSPTDMYNLVDRLTNIGYMRISSRNINPSPETSYFFGNKNNN